MEGLIFLAIIFIFFGIPIYLINEFFAGRTRAEQQREDLKAEIRKLNNRLDKKDGLDTLGGNKK